MYDETRKFGNTVNTVLRITIKEREARQENSNNYLIFHQRWVYNSTVETNEIDVSNRTRFQVFFFSSHRSVAIARGKNKPATLLALAREHPRDGERVSTYSREGYYHVTVEIKNWSCIGRLSSQLSRLYNVKHINILHNISRSAKEYLA